MNNNVKQKLNYMTKLNSNQNSSTPNTINTAIRIPTDVYEKINNQAIQEDKTISSIINHVLRKYVSWDQFVSDVGFVFLQKPFVNVFLKIFQKKI